MLLLLPGMDGTGRLFAPLLARLPPTIATRTIAYPGDQPLGYAELLTFVRGQLPAGDYFLLAESFSGPLALCLAGERPPGLRGLIFASTFAASPMPWLPRWSHALARPWLFGGVGPGSRLGLGLDSCPPEITTLLRDALATVSPTVLARRAREILSVEAPRSPISLPALVLAARRDRLVGHATVDALTALLPRAEVVWFDAPHLLLQARPDEAASTISEWVELQRSSTP